ncbi:MAG: ABC transporter substrate-binding protein [Pseudomonadota bacterium]
MRLSFQVVVVVALLLAGPVRAEPVLRLAVLKFGTVNWLTETIQNEGLDRAAGYRLEVVPLAGKAATTIAFEAGDADLIVSDWVWALGRRAEGNDLRFAPYSGALGALMVRGDSGVRTLCDLQGQNVGVVGGAIDKSWLIYEALAARDCGFSLDEETQTLLGAPPLMSRELETGGVEAVSTYWHYAARLRAAGMREVIDVVAALGALGIEPAPPLVGFVWNAEGQDPVAVAAFLDSVHAAGALLARDDVAWDRVRPLMRVEDDASFEALVEAYRAGIPDGWDEADTTAAKALYESLVATGGTAFARGAGRWDPVLFDAPVAGDPSPNGG